MALQARLLHQFATLSMDLWRLFAWLVLLIVIFLPLERLWPVVRRKVVRKNVATDLAYYFLSGIAPKLLLILPLSFLAAAVHRIAGGGFYQWTAALPVSLRISAAIVVAEIGFYWGHRWSHEIPFLWRFHAIHHSAEEIDWLVSSRVHPVDLVFMRLCGLVPMYLLGLAQPAGNRLDLVPMLATVIATAWGFFVHANLRWRFGWLEYLVSSPAFHHWHHTNDSPECIDKNFAPMLPLIDQLFGTLHIPRGEWPRTYGTNTPVAPTISAQLLEPLTPQG